MHGVRGDKGISNRNLIFCASSPYPIISVVDCVLVMLTSVTPIVVCDFTTKVFCFATVSLFCLFLSASLYFSKRGAY